ncbi:hypothetical protein [Halobacteriovorax sp. JY17]|uniref:hypothetical protein n=1 Tax=Halobacteriovorax sp. JY17 TaxID=2014617 RepID=UPI000C5FD9E2|nr:hypothetical protein [Halobacteriovorax sp. JY17]PIK14879.1 MAG: hypothetical protein CES88_11140 [Halobacteriovorax sp. JY17]
MKKAIVSLLLLTASAFTFAQDADLNLPGERWITTFKDYVCNNRSGEVAAPREFTAINAKFETATTDFSLDNGLIKATFEENGKVCRYSALLLADNLIASISLVDSKAYAVNGDTECTEGKEILDNAFRGPNDYLYYGHPHNLAIMVPLTDADNICPNNGSTIGVNFVLSGRVQ